MAASFQRLEGNVWLPYKQLERCVTEIMNNKDSSRAANLNDVLKSHRVSFTTVLTNPGQRQDSLDALTKAATDGIAIAGSQSKQILQQSFVDDAKLFSELFNLNEIASLEFIIAGEQQKQNYLNLSRGLVAVILYYDAKRSLVASLRLLLLAASGNHWTADLPLPLAKSITLCVRQLFDQDDMFQKLLTTIDTFDPKVELDKLQSNRALGGPRYQKQVVEMLAEIRSSLADCIFCYVNQMSVNQAQILELLKWLSKMKIEGAFGRTELALVMAAVSAFDVTMMEDKDDKEVLECDLTILEPAVLKSVHDKLFVDQLPAWHSAELKATVQLSWALMNRFASQTLQMPGLPTLNDGVIQDTVLRTKIFEFIRKIIVQADGFSEQEFYIRRIHCLVTDFIIYMPDLVKFLDQEQHRIDRMDSVNAMQGLRPASHELRNFENMLLLISDLYSKDDLDLKLATDYWEKHPSDAGVRSASAASREYTRGRSHILNQFVRIYREVTVPYLMMLTSLSSSPETAHRAYNLLKDTGGTVSWHHFFTSLSRYYTYLDGERSAAPKSDSDHLYRTNKGISPHELEGLLAVLNLIKAIANADDVCRTSLQENSQLKPVHILLYLLTCNVPSVMKSAILRCVAAFAKSPSITSLIWQMMEHLQILQTVNTTSNYVTGGMQRELEDVESKAEEYPMTRAFVDLIQVLVTTDANSGNSAQDLKSVGYRPYAEFIINNVLCNFGSRSYKNPAEKWEVASCCLKVIVQLVDNFEPIVTVSEDSRMELNETSIRSMPSAFSILISLMQESSLWKMIISIIHEGIGLLDQHTDLPGRKKLEDSTLDCLKLIELALAKQSSITEYCRMTNAADFALAIDKLLCGINPRSGKADIVYKIARYITHNRQLPEHSLWSVKILIWLSQSVFAQPKLLQMLACGLVESDIIRYAFIECIESEDSEDVDSDTITNPMLYNSIRQNIITLLRLNIQTSAPNIAHYFLGFDLQKSLSKTSLSDPGIDGVKKSSLHAILFMLQRGLTDDGYVQSAYVMPYFTQLVNQLIYLLCADPVVSAPVLRYLRTSHDFFNRQLNHVPHKLDVVGSRLRLYKQQAWLLKAAAIEIRCLAATNQISQLQRLLGIFFPSNSGPDRSDRAVIVDVLHELDLTVGELPLPDTTLLDRVDVEAVLFACEDKQADNSASLINISQLNALLYSNQLMSSYANADRAALMGECAAIVQYAIQRNDWTECNIALEEYIDGWRRVLDTALSVAGSYIANEVAMDIAHLFITRLFEDGRVNAKLVHCSSVLLSLTKHLKTHVTTHKEEFRTSCSYRVVSSITEGLIRVLLEADPDWLKYRCDHYGALLNILHLAQNQTLDATTLDGATRKATKFSLRLMKDIANCGEKLIETVCNDSTRGHEVCRMLALSCIDVICNPEYETYNQWLQYMESSGYLRHVVDSLKDDDKILKEFAQVQTSVFKTIYLYQTKMAALIRLSSSQLGAQHLVSNGVLTVLSNCAAYSNCPVQEIVSIGNISTLDEDDSEDDLPEDNDILSVTVRFKMILEPALRLCLNLLVSHNSTEVQSQVLSFIVSHSESLLHLLRYTPHMLTNASLNALQIVSLLTSVLARCVALDVINDFSITRKESRDIESVLPRFHRQIMMLPPCYAALLKAPSCHVGGARSDVLKPRTTDISLVTTKVLSNMFLYWRVFVDKSMSSGTETIKVLFSTKFMDGSRGDFYANEDFQGTVVDSNKPLSLGFCVKVINQFLDNFFEAHALRQLMVVKQEGLGSCSVTDIQEFMGEFSMDRRYWEDKSRESMEARLTELINERSEFVALYSSIVESALFLLWRHLDYYLMHCSPVDEGAPLYHHAFKQVQAVKSLSSPRVHSASGVRVGTPPEIKISNGITREDISQLKTDCVTYVSDSLLGKLIQFAEKNGSQSKQYTFVESIVRKLQRLVKIQAKS